MHNVKCQCTLERESGSFSFEPVVESRIFLIDTYDCYPRIILRLIRVSISFEMMDKRNYFCGDVCLSWLIGSIGDDKLT